MVDTQIIYGHRQPNDTLVLLDGATAKRRAQEVALVQAATTWAELRALAPQLSVIHLPVDEDDEDMDGAEPFDWSESSAVLDGDWPQEPSFISLDWLAPQVRRVLTDEGLLQSEASALNGDMTYIDPAREGRLVEILRAQGLTVERDDDLVLRVAGGID